MALLIKSIKNGAYFLFNNVFSSLLYAVLLIFNL